MRPPADNYCMVGAFVLASVVAMQTTLSLQAEAATRIATAVDPPATPSPAPDPCAHRFLCGRIRIVPADPAERRVWYLRAASELADALISAAAERAIATYHVTSVAAPGGTYSAQWKIATSRPADQEQTQFYRLFAGRSGIIGFGGYVLGFAFWDIGQNTGARLLEHFGIRTDDVTVDGAIAHLDGAASWHTSSWLSRDQQLMRRCVAAVARQGSQRMSAFFGCPNVRVKKP